MLQFHTPPPAGAAPNSPQAVIARGADPAVDVPAGAAHFFRRILNLPFQTPPGALFAQPSLLPLSIIEAIGGPALNVNNDAAVRQSFFLLRGVFPEKIDAAISQLEAEPAGVGLDPAAIYESMSHAASAVLAAVARVAQRSRSGFPVHQAYLISIAVDTYDHEPMAPGTLAALVALGQPPSALCFSHLEGEEGFLVHYGVLAFSLYGRCLAASRDAPGSPTRRFLADAHVLSEQAGLARAQPAGALATPASLISWLEATTPPFFVAFRAIVGLGADAREQAMRDQHMLRFGTDDQKQILVASLASKEPLRSRLPNLFAVLSPTSVSGAASHLGRLCRAANLAGLRSVLDLSSLFTLDGAIKDAVRSLTAPGLVVTTVEDRLARVEEFFSSTAPAPGVSSGGAPAASRSAYGNELSLLVSQPSWRATEASLAAELAGECKPLFIFEALMTSSVLGARQLALGKTVSDELKRLLQLSKVLQKSVDVLNNGPYVRHKLVADAFVASRVSVLGAPPSLKPVTDPEIRFHTQMPKEMSSAILRGAFDEINWIEFLRLLLAVQRPNNQVAPYANGWHDPHFVSLILPHLERMSALLGLPSTLVPGSLPVPLPAVFGTLSSVVTTISRQHADIVGVPSAFTSENLKNLAKFTTGVFPEMSRRYNSFYSRADPSGPLPLSLFEDPSAALADLRTLQKSIASQEELATNEEIIYSLAASVAPYGTLEAMLAHFGSKRRATASPSPGRAEPSPKRQGRGKDKEVKEDAVRPPSRADSERSSRSPSQSRAPSPGPLGSRKDSVQHSADGSGFWYQDPTTGRKASAVYTYDVLEQIAGKSRDELDFPVILSHKSTPQARATLCCFEGKPGHEHATSSAHVAPFGDFVARVQAHFGAPASARASTSARSSRP